MASGKRENHMHGAKFCKHTTVTDSTRKVAQVVQKFPEVEKISLGVIEGKGSGNFSMKFISIPAGWRIIVCGSHATQKLHVYTSNPSETRNKLETEFPGCSR